MDAIFQEQHALALRHEKKRQDIRERLAANRRREREMNKAAAKEKRAAGISQVRSQARLDDSEIDARRWNGADTRNLTGQILGDPIANDPRCPWRPQVAR